MDINYQGKIAIDVGGAEAGIENVEKKPAANLRSGRTRKLRIISKRCAGFVVNA